MINDDLLIAAEASKVYRKHTLEETEKFLKGLSEYIDLHDKAWDTVLGMTVPEGMSEEDAEAFINKEYKEVSKLIDGSPFHLLNDIYGLESLEIALYSWVKAQKELVK